MEALDPNFRDDIDSLAGHFLTKGQFESIFINRLVPWDDLVGEPNSGHAAVADFLLSSAVEAARSANVDGMMEQWAERHKVYLRGALDGVEAVQFSAETRPLFKFHGCLRRKREETLWTQQQIALPPFAARLDTFREWMNVHLPGKHLLVIGFWTDWKYLNDVLARVMTARDAFAVTVVDPVSAAELETKAPNLWNQLHALSDSFRHIQISGDEFLSAVRAEFSIVWLKKFLLIGKNEFEGSGGNYPPPHADFAGLSLDELYDLRRDAEGAPYDRAARWRTPIVESARTALTHLLLLRAGAARRGPWYEHRGLRIRVVHGAGQGLTTVKERYREPATIPQSEIVICAGSYNYGVPGRLIPGGSGGSIMRPGAGGASRWITLEDAIAEFHL